MTLPTDSTTTESNEIFRFGPYRLDPAARELRRGDEEITVQPKSMACLMYLIARRDRAVDRDELIEAIWGHSHLTDGALTQTILQLRRALDDGEGEGARFVKSVRGFGYRWVAETQVERVAGENPQPLYPLNELGYASPSSTPTTPTRRFYGPIVAVVLVVALLVVGGIAKQWIDNRSDGSAPMPAAVSSGLVLILPVDVTDATESGWVRLGIMDMISSQLQRAGMTVVPVETVLKLLRGHDEESPAERARRLVDATGSKWVLSIRAVSVEQLWSVSIRGLTEHGPAEALRGEAPDILAATHQAVDMLALALGAPAGAGQMDDPELQLLQYRVRAAHLERRLDEGQALIEASSAELRGHPQIRRLMGLIHYAKGNLPLARKALEELLQDPVAMQDPELMMRARGNLAVTLSALGEREQARAMMLDVVSRASETQNGRTMGYLSANLGLIALEDGDRAAARRYVMQARRMATGSGDIQVLTYLDFLIGIFDDDEDRPNESLRHLERARSGIEAIGDELGLIHVLAATMETQLQLLDVRAAEAIEPKLQSISTSSAIGQHASVDGVALATLRRAQGEISQASAILDSMIADPAVDQVSVKCRIGAYALRARWLVEDGGPADQAIQAARAVIASEETLRNGELRRIVAQAWLAQVRAETRRHRMDEARRALEQFAAWRGSGDTPSTKAFLMLARAELADADGRVDEARIHYDEAMRISDSVGAPQLALEVAQSFVPWLLRQSDGAVEALWVSDRLSVYQDQHFDAALIRLRVLHRTGPVASWRSALRVTESLAGERAIPHELLSVPETAAE